MSRYDNLFIIFAGPLKHWTTDTSSVRWAESLIVLLLIAALVITMGPIENRRASARQASRMQQVC